MIHALLLLQGTKVTSNSEGIKPVTLTIVMAGRLVGQSTENPEQI